MAIHTDQVGIAHRGRCFSWTTAESQLYAVAVGAGESDAGLPFTTGSSPVTLPLFAVILSGRAGLPSLDLAGDVDLRQVLHVGQRVELVRRTVQGRTVVGIATQGEAYAMRTLSRVADTGKHAILDIATTLVDSLTGLPFARVTTTTLVRGAGGFGGTLSQRTAAAPAGDPTGQITFATRPEQALLYRLTGDRNPLHTDPDVAKAAGFDRPILHGLATLGIAAQQLQLSLKRVPTAISASFTAPVTPGDVLTTSYWTGDDTVRFETRVNERIVISDGVLGV